MTNFDEGNNAGAAGERKTLLLADDAAVTRRILKHLLEGEYDIIEAENGLQAIEAMERHSEIAMVLLDIVMPVMDGWAVLDAMRESGRLAELPVLIVTADDSVDSVIKALDCGAVDVITKPYRPQIILSRIRNTLWRMEAARIAEQNRAFELRIQRQAARLRQAEHDARTGLYTKEAFYGRVRERLDAEPGRRFIIVRLDVDRFKVFNDLFGTAAGDSLLRAIGDMLSEQTKGESLLARIEADHFACFVPEEDFNADAFCARLRYWVDEYPARFKLSFSIGIYPIGATDFDVGLMCDRALLALRSVKSKYEVKYALYDDSLRRTLLEEQRLMTDIDKALAGGQFRLFYQPQFDQVTGSMIGAEALVRWVHPELGTISPHKFVSLFENNGLITRLDGYVWESACAFLRNRIDAGRPVVPLSVNISRKDFFSFNVCERFAALMNKYSLRPSLLRLEVTESAYMDNPDQLASEVRQLRAHGFSVEMDDFGSGYSSLNTLRDLPVDMLKLDMRFLDAADDGGRSGIVLNSIIRMAQWLKLPVIAEGVETVRQADYLRTVGCRFAQGYLFARPMTEEAFDKLLDSKTTLDIRPFKVVSSILSVNEFWTPEAQATLVFNSFVGAACILEQYGDEYEVLRVNDRFYEETAVPRAELAFVGSCIRGLLADEDRAPLRAMLDSAVKTGDEARCEARWHSWSDASKFVWLRVRARAIARSDTRRVFYLTVENITAQKEAEASLRESEQEIRLAMSRMGKSICHYDARTRRLTVPDEYARAHGIGRVMENIPYSARTVAPESRDAFNGFYESIIAGVPHGEALVKYNTDDKRELWEQLDFSAIFAEDGSPKSAVVAVEDVTLKRKFDALEANFIAAARHAGLIFWEYDPQKARMSAGYEDLRRPDMPSVMDDYPESFLAAGYIHAQSAADYRALHEDMKRALPESERRIRLSEALGGGWYLVRYTNSFDAAGRPALCLATAQPIDDFKEMEERFTVAAENEGLCVWSIELATGQVYQTPKMIELYGEQRKVGDVRALTEDGWQAESVHPDDAAAYKAAYARLFAGEKNVSLRLRRLNRSTGRWDWHHVTYTLVTAADGRFLRVVGSAVNINALVEAERKFQTFKRYSEVASRGAIASFRLNLTANWCGDGASELDELLALQDDGDADGFFRRALALMPEGEEREKRAPCLTREWLAEAYSRGEASLKLDFQARLSRRGPMWLRAVTDMMENPENGDLEAVIQVFDIGPEKRASAVIRWLAGSYYDFIATFDAAGERVELFASAPSYVAPPKGAGYPRQLESALVEYIEPEKRDEARALLSLEAVLGALTKSDSYSITLKARPLNGKTRYKRWNYAYLGDDRSHVIFARIDVTDVVESEFKQRELMESALSQARQASGAKSEFLSRMSHEIRTPLNAIIGMTALAARSPGEVSLVTDSLSKIGISAHYLLSLINDILDMSRIESGRMLVKSERFSFEELISGVNALCYAQAGEKGVDYEAIIVSFADEYYLGDAVKLKQVLTNIIGNAIKFTPAGGKAQLIVAPKRLSPREASLKFTVSDTGIGMSADFLKRAFEPFEQEHVGLSTEYGGTGLGLAISKHLVELMGGSISASSIPGVGSEFRVEVKLGTVEDGGALSRAVRALPRLSVLVVDDDALVCRQTERILEEIGMAGQWVASGTEAVRLVSERAKRGEHYDVILVDWRMPELDGIETARRIRAIVGPEVTIIIITAYDWAEIEAEARLAGVNAFISKPLFRSSLTSTLERIYLGKSAPAGDTSPESEYDFSGRRALLVEDHPLNTEVARRLLQAGGMAVDAVENGLLALQKIAEMPEKYYDVVLMDIRMPVMDGLTATRAIRQMTKKYAREVPIIAMSANAFDEDVEKSKAAGMNAHIAKPVEPRTMYRVLAEHMGVGASPR